MRLFLLFFFLGCLFVARDAAGQTGIHIATGGQQFPGWSILAGESQHTIKPQFPATFYGLGVDYWFRLNNVRIEFFPGLHFSNTYRGKVNVAPEHFTEWNWQRYSALWNTHFYLLDMQDDCSCPSFSKQGNFIEQAFFVSIGLGAQHFRGTVKHAESGNDGKWAQTAPFLALGAGLDFGLSDFITVTPYFQWHYTPSVEWPGLNTHIHDESSILDIYNETSARHQLFGIRVGFRWDEIRRF